MDMFDDKCAGLCGLNFFFFFEELKPLWAQFLNQIYSMHKIHLPALKPGDGKWYMYLHLYTDRVLITLATYMHSHAHH